MLESAINGFRLSEVVVGAIINDKKRLDQVEAIQSVFQVGKFRTTVGGTYY